MRCKERIIGLTTVCIFLMVAAFAAASGVDGDTQWKIHDTRQPLPKIIEPGTSAAEEKPGIPPSDAVILFDGKDLSQWRTLDGKPARWIVKDGCMQPVKGSGDIRTYRCFGDCQLHIEFAAPLPPAGEGQARGNSGVFLMSMYEVQILDSYNNTTYADGQAAAMYGQYVPQVNACREPGKWQTYDIIFHAPLFAADRGLVSPAYITALHNGVLVHDHAALKGPTSWLQRLPYRSHPAKLPLSLQDHGSPVRFRSIWIRELPAPGKNDQIPKPEIALAYELLDRYTGSYKIEQGGLIEIARQENRLFVAIDNNPIEAVVAHSETTFSSPVLAAELTFDMDEKGVVHGLELILCGAKMIARKVK